MIHTYTGERANRLRALIHDDLCFDWHLGDADYNERGICTSMSYTSDSGLTATYFYDDGTLQFEGKARIPRPASLPAASLPEASAEPRCIECDSPDVHLRDVEYQTGVVLHGVSEILCEQLWFCRACGTETDEIAWTQDAPAPYAWPEGVAPVQAEVA